MNKNIYGALYNWYTFNTSKLCPIGWNGISDFDWMILKSYLGDASFAGGMMKETGTLHWKFPNTGATNESGFTALPGGQRSGYNGEFLDLGEKCYWWTTTEYPMNPPEGWLRMISYDLNSLQTLLSGKSGHTEHLIPDQLSKRSRK